MSSSYTDEDSDGRGRERARLINDCLTELFDVRAKCERARTLNAEVPTQHRIALYSAIRDTYLALRPLREEDAIKSWWESVTLSPRWGEWHEVEPDHEDAVPFATDENDDPVYGVWLPYSGLGTLDDLRDPVREEEIAVHVFGGVKRERRTEPDPLPYDILLDISSTLEDAAQRLGFAPAIGVQDVTDPDPV